MHYVYDLAGDLTFTGRGLLDGANHAAPNTGYYYGGLSLTYKGTTQPLNVTSDLPVNANPVRYDVATSLSYSPLGGIASAGIGDEFMQTSTYAKRGWLQQRNSTDFNGNQTLMDTINHDAHGNVQNVSDTLTGEFVYCYDTLDRLLQVVGPLSGSYSCPSPFTPYSGSMAATHYGYDAFGTLNSRSVSSGSGFQFSFAANSHNQDPSRSYDAAGNLLNDGVHTYTYDAESRISSVVDQNTQYSYDAEGSRVATRVNGQTAETDFLYDLNGTLVTTVGTATYTMVRSSLYAAGQHWGDFKGTGGTGTTAEFRLGDEVGTLLYDYDQNGNLVNQCASGPFGESLACNPSTDFTETHFADKKRDSESNLDYFGARYYSSTLGRFMSPDWSDGPDSIPYADLTMPQTLNLYSYAGNNPLSNIDSDGHDFDLQGGGLCGGDGGINCDAQGFVLGPDGNREVITDQQLANGGYGVSAGANGGINITTAQGTFAGQFFDASPGAVSATVFANQQQGDINAVGIGVVQQIGRQTGPTYSAADAFVGRLITDAACSAVGIGAGFKSFVGVPPGMMGGAQPSAASMLNSARSAGGVSTAKAATATGELLAARIASPILSRATARAVPVAGQVLRVIRVRSDGRHHVCAGLPEKQRLSNAEPFRVSNVVVSWFLFKHIRC